MVGRSGLRLGEHRVPKGISRVLGKTVKEQSCGELLRFGPGAVPIRDFGERSASGHVIPQLVKQNSPNAVSKPNARVSPERSSL